MNFNGFNALCCEKNGYVQIPWEHPSNNQFAVCIQFLPDNSSICGTLISFDSILGVKIVDGHIQFIGNNFDEISEETVLQRCRNTVALNYDGKNISVYCNGSLVLQRDIPFELAQMTHLRVGENLSAVCIYKVTIFHRPLTSMEIHTGLVKKLSGFHRQIDFTLPSLPKDIILQQCSIQNCVYTLDCKHGGLIVPYTNLPKEYTVNFSIYFFKQNQEELVLFKSSLMCIKLCCDSFGSGSPHVKIEKNNREICFTLHTVKTNQWINLTVVFSNSKVTVYFNGVEQGDGTYEATDETGQVEFGQFDGYLDNCAIIKRSLTQNEISDYVKQSPNVFDDDILYLYNFSANLWQESCQGTMLTPSGAKIVLAKETGADIREDKSKQAPQSDRTYSDFVNWQILLLLKLLVNWIYEQFGIYPNKGVRIDCNPWEIDVNLHHFIHKEILSLKEAQILLFHYDNLDSQEFLNLILAMKQNGTLKKLMDYLYQENDEQDSVSDILMALLATAAFLAALLAMLGKAIGSMKPVPKPPNPPRSDFDNDDDDDDDDDEKKKKTFVSIKQTSLKGNLKIEFGQKDISQDSGKTAVFFTHGNSENTRLTASFSHKGDEGKFTVFAENKEGKVIPSSQKSVSFQGSTSVEISLDVNPKKFEKSYGKCTETVRWRCESSDGKQAQFLGETSYEIYFLENAPCKMWNNTVHIECLKLCADCAEHVGENSEGFVKDYARFIQDKNRLDEYNIDSVSTIVASARICKKAYSRIPMQKGRKMVFDAVRFATDFRRGNRGIPYRDLVYSNAVLGYLNGHQDIKVLWLSANLPCEGMSVSARLLVKKDENASGFYCLKDSAHYVIEDADNKIYDSYLGSYGLPFSKNKDRCVTDVNDGKYYRESIYLEGSCCMVIGEIGMDVWTLGNLSAESNETVALCEINNLPENPAFGFIRPRAGGGYVYDYRTDANPDVYRWVRERDPLNEFNIPNPNVCHSISSFDIDMTIADICTNRQDGLIRLNALVDALYPVDLGDGFIRAYKNYTVRLINVLDRCLGNANEYTNDVISHFCFLTANSPANLRLGAGVWNRHVGRAFDPSSWFFYSDANARWIISDRGLDEELIGENFLVELRNRYGGFPNPINNNPSFYLPDRADGIRISKMREAGYHVSILCKCLWDPGPVFYPFVCSSSNQFEFPGNLDRYINLPSNALPNIPIYYLDNNAWTAL